ncbi:NADH-ubiquinone oxidoreductase chain 2 [Armadillidium vulgare]|nr:NADH-ubiquinone oxidoreductase chain 2 [Armadillidium vulgare]
MLFIRGKAISGAPSINGINQLPNPPIIIENFSLKKNSLNNINLPFLISITINFGKNPNNGGNPPKDKKQTNKVNFATHFLFLLKLGAAPFYFWYLWVGGLNKGREVIIYSSIIVGGVVGGIGGINEASLRKLLVYSSLNHIGWIIIPLVVENDVRISWIAKLTLFVSFLSLGGLPPLLGFFPKFIVIEIRSGRSVVTLFYYLRARLSVLILDYRKIKSNFTFSEKFSIILIIIITIIGGILGPYILYLGFEQGLLGLPLE